MLEVSSTPTPPDCPTLPGLVSQSQDLDNSGTCEDINGNGFVDFVDIVELFQYLNNSGQYVAELDFNDNSKEDMDDVVTLFNIMVSTR